MAAAVKPISGRYQLTVREQLSFAPALNRGTLFSLVCGALLAGLALLSLVSGDSIGASVALAFAFALYSGYYVVPFAWFTLRRNRSAAEAPVEVFVTDDGFRFETSLTTMEVPWVRVRRIRETPSGFLVTARFPHAFMLPQRAFGPAQLIAFRRLAATKTIFRTA